MKLLLVPELSFQFAFFCIFCLTILILLWYYLFYFSRVALYKEKESTSNYPPTSVIICAKNEDHNLPEFLPLILGQDYPEFEVVVVDDCSSDNTPDILRELEKKYKHLKAITVKEDKNHHHGKKFALMVGIKGATYEHLLFTDGDCKPMDSQWMKMMMRNFSDKNEIVVGYSKYEQLPGLLNKIIRFDTFHIALQYLSFAKAGAAYMGVGRNLAYKKSLFFKHRGFATHYHIESGDDDLFVNQATTGENTYAEISPESFTVSIVKKTWASWVEQKRRHLTTWIEYKLKDKILLGIYPIAQMSFWILFFILLLFYAIDGFPKPDIYILLSLFLVRIMVQHIVFKLAMDRLKEKDLLVLSLIAELFLIVFYPLVTISNRLYHRQKWKRI